MSNAPAMSTARTCTALPVLIQDNHWWFMLVRRSAVPKPVRKPNWCFEKRFSFSKSVMILLFTTFSMTLERKLSRDTAIVVDGCSRLFLLDWRWRKRERARAGIEPTAAAPSRPDGPGVSRSDHSAGSKESASWRALELRSDWHGQLGNWRREKEGKETSGRGSQDEPLLTKASEDCEKKGKRSLLARDHGLRAHKVIYPLNVNANFRTIKSEADLNRMWIGSNPTL